MIDENYRKDEQKNQILENTLKILNQYCMIIGNFSWFNIIDNQNILYRYFDLKESIIHLQYNQKSIEGL